MFSSWTIQKKLLFLFACIFIPSLILALAEGMAERNREIAKAKREIVIVAESLAAQQLQIVNFTR